MPVHRLRQTGNWGTGLRISAAVVTCAAGALALGCAGKANPGAALAAGAVPAVEAPRQPAAIGAADPQNQVAGKPIDLGTRTDSKHELIDIVPYPSPDRSAQNQVAVVREEAVSERLARELLEVYRDLFPAMPIEEQLRRLPGLLDDPRPGLREFGVSRIALMVRDSVRIPQQTQQKLSERLADGVPSLRIQAARLLAELNDDSLAASLVQRLPEEKSPQVAAAWFEILAKRTHPDTLQSAPAWMEHEEVGDKAADAAWTTLAIFSASPEQIESLQAPARAALRQRSSAAATRLLASIGNETDVALVTQLLDGENPALRGAVAEGFCRRGLRQLLVDRAADEFIYPFALRALWEGPKNLAAMRQLIDLSPSEAMKGLWVEAVMKLAEGLQVADLFAADDMIGAVLYGDLALRRDILLRAALLPREQLSGELRVRIVGRVAPILLELNDYGRAHELLETINGEPAAAPLRRLRFKAAALSGQYERAAQHEPDHKHWLDLLADLAKRDAAAARQLHDEIARRFNDKINGDDRQRLQIITDRLRREEPQVSLGAVPQ